jgi:protein-disulfide isomerase
MRKSILVTVAIAAVAIGLALGVSQSDNIKAAYEGVFKPEQSTQDSIASAVSDPETTTVASEETEATTPATTTEATPAEEPATTETVTADATTAPAMTEVDLDKAPAATQEDLNAQSPAAGEEAAATEEAPATKYKVDVQASLQDRSIGSASAPITVYDFSSLTCPHCAVFHNQVLPKVKQYYIDTGKVRWVFKGFPLNEPALKAEMIARCAPKDQYIKLIDLMYENQARWAFEESAMANLNMMLRLAGVSDDQFLACANSKELQEGYLKEVQANTEKFDLKATPTFVFNDGEKTFSGGGTYEGFAFDLDALLKTIEMKKSTPITDKK